MSQSSQSNNYYQLFNGNHQQRTNSQASTVSFQSTEAGPFSNEASIPSTSHSFSSKVRRHSFPVSCVGSSKTNDDGNNNSVELSSSLFHKRLATIATNSHENIKKHIPGDIQLPTYLSTAYTPPKAWLQDLDYQGLLHHTAATQYTSKDPSATLIHITHVKEQLEEIKLMNVNLVKLMVEVRNQLESVAKSMEASQKTHAESLNHLSEAINNVNTQILGSTSTDEKKEEELSRCIKNSLRDVLSSNNGINTLMDFSREESTLSNDDDTNSENSTDCCMSLPQHIQEALLAAKPLRNECKGNSHNEEVFEHWLSEPQIDNNDASLMTRATKRSRVQ